MFAQSVTCLSPPTKLQQHALRIIITVSKAGILPLGHGRDGLRNLAFGHGARRDEADLLHDITTTRGSSLSPPRAAAGDLSAGRKHLNGRQGRSALS